MTAPAPSTSTDYDVLRGARVCLVSTGQPSTNPRLVKEAAALSGAGADVHVVACKFQPWAEEADAIFDDRNWTVHWLRFGTQAPRWKDLWQRARRKAARALIRRTGLQPGLAERAFHYVIPELTRTTRAVEADLYVGHNLAALPAAARAARAHGARLGFDAEDFHRGELPDDPAHDFDRALTAFIEERWMPRCDYLTAASDGIADAYADALDVPRPTTILNVFPWSERSTDVAPEDLAAETPDGAHTLYWFSQTIGPDRGLEDALQALPHLPDDVHLALRGQWASGYEDAFHRQAERLGVADRIYHLALVPPNELVPLTREHSIGLALEPGFSTNNQIAVSNKLFSYLIAGIPVVATSTPGQRPIVNDLPRAAASYPPGDVDAFVQGTRALLDDDRAPAAALDAARDRYSWDVEKHRFLHIVAAAANRTSG